MDPHSSSCIVQVSTAYAVYKKFTKYNAVEGLKIKGWRKIHHENIKRKNSVATVTSKQRKLPSRDKRVSLSQNIATGNVCAPKNRAE